MRRLPLPLHTGQRRVLPPNRIPVTLALLALVTVMVVPSPVSALPNPLDELRKLSPGTFGFPAVRGMPNSGGPSGPAATIRQYIAWQAFYAPIGHSVQHATSPYDGDLNGAVDYNIVPSKRYVVAEGDMLWSSSAVATMQSDYFNCCSTLKETAMVFHTFKPASNDPTGINIDTGITASDLPGAQVTYPADNEVRFYIADPNNMVSSSIYFAYQAFVDTNYNGSNLTSGQLTMTTYRTNVALMPPPYYDSAKDDNAKLCITDNMPPGNLGPDRVAHPYGPAADLCS